nr:hypothetical protein [Streptomyces gardneri]
MASAAERAAGVAVEAYAATGVAQVAAGGLADSKEWQRGSASPVTVRNEASWRAPSAEAAVSTSVRARQSEWRR